MNAFPVTDPDLDAPDGARVFLSDRGGFFERSGQTWQPVHVRTWFTSDTHFGHANIIRYCGRPFADVQAMNEALVQAWNARVGPRDLVYHLGDFSLGSREVLEAHRSRLHGDIVLVRGNHDRRSRAFYLARGFLGVHRFIVLGTPYGRVVLTHRPPVPDQVWPPGVRTWLCGHVHEKWARRTTDQGLVLNVGVDANRFQPWSLDEVLGPG